MGAATVSAPRDEAILDVNGLESWFDAPEGIVRAVRNVSLSIGPREAVGIVGESGSGKTQTFLSAFGLSHGAPGLIAGSARVAGVDLLEGLSRYVHIDGDESRLHVRKKISAWNKVHHARLKGVLGRDVALMSQDPKRSLVPYWTVKRHLLRILQRKNAPQSAAQRAEALIAQFGFQNPGRVLDAFPQQLSGGEAQRVMLALTMAISPRLLIADEPTTALDAVNQIKVLTELARIHAESDMALVLISHDLAVVAGLVSRVLVFFGGRVLERAPVSILGEGKNTQQHPYTGELLESQRRRAAGQPIAASTRSLTRVRAGEGCPYANRCTLRPRLNLDLQTRCESEFPAEREVEPGHFIACWGIT